MGTGRGGGPRRPEGEAVAGPGGGQGKAGGLTVAGRCLGLQMEGGVTTNKAAPRRSETVGGGRMQGGPASAKKHLANNYICISM